MATWLFRIPARVWQTLQRKAGNEESREGRFRLGRVNPIVDRVTGKKQKAPPVGFEPSTHRVTVRRRHISNDVVGALWSQWSLRSPGPQRARCLACVGHLAVTSPELARAACRTNARLPSPQTITRFCAPPVAGRVVRWKGHPDHQNCYKSRGQCGRWSGWSGLQWGSTAGVMIASYGTTVCRAVPLPSKTRPSRPSRAVRLGIPVIPVVRPLVG